MRFHFFVLFFLFCWVCGLLCYQLGRKTFALRFSKARFDFNWYLLFFWLLGPGSGVPPPLQFLPAWLQFAFFCCPVIFLEDVLNIRNTWWVFRWQEWCSKWCREALKLLFFEFFVERVAQVEIFLTTEDPTKGDSKTTVEKLLLRKSELWELLIYFCWRFRQSFQYVCAHWNTGTNQAPPWTGIYTSRYQTVKFWSLKWLKSYTVLYTCTVYYFSQFGGLCSHSVLVWWLLTW